MNNKNKAERWWNKHMTPRATSANRDKIRKSKFLKHIK